MKGITPPATLIRPHYLLQWLEATLCQDLLPMEILIARKTILKMTFVHQIGETPHNPLRTGGPQHQIGAQVHLEGLEEEAGDTTQMDRMNLLTTTVHLMTTPVEPNLG